MGLVTIDPHSLKEHTEIHKIPKFGVIGLVQTEKQRFKNVKISKEMYGHPDAVYICRTASGWPYISL